MTVKCAAVVLLVVLLGASAGWAQDFGAPRDRYFRLDWEAGQPRCGRPTVTGTIFNDHPGLWLVNVRLLVEELDASGRPVSRTVGYVNDEAPPKRRAYFEVWVPVAAATYRVTVQSFDFRRGVP
jgi:hypothetical protein